MPKWRSLARQIFIHSELHLIGRLNGSPHLMANWFFHIEKEKKYYFESSVCLSRWEDDWYTSWVFYLFYKQRKRRKRHALVLIFWQKGGSRGKGLAWIKDEPRTVCEAPSLIAWTVYTTLGKAVCYCYFYTTTTTTIL